ncbi:hypothetical protein BOX15_Mlig001791g4 [Macrostomum lignano]|uniref:Uncharacterized protein n=2 Tax=Macrostomum lignano TaxID=282301 RepID=A0A267FY92_9PLAT|nr:hypothetical protein BOX15_Mlig001791g4 [Macrostomum lignano]
MRAQRPSPRPNQQLNPAASLKKPATKAPSSAAMYKLVCLFALVAFAAAAYTPEQKNEVVNDIIHEVVPVISIDTNCLKQNGISSVNCLISNLATCYFAHGTNISQLAGCLANKCGGSAIQILSCIKL